MGQGDGGERRHYAGGDHPGRDPPVGRLVRRGQGIQKDEPS